jgi:hypothetical protein
MAWPSSARVAALHAARLEPGRLRVRRYVGDQQARGKRKNRQSQLRVPTFFGDARKNIGTM